MIDTAYKVAIRTDWSGRADSQRAGAVVARSLRASGHEALGFQFNGDLWYLQGATTEGLTTSSPPPRRLPGALRSPAPAGVLTYDASANNDFTDNTYYVADTLKKAWAWSTYPVTWSQWHGYGNDLSGNLLIW